MPNGNSFNVQHHHHKHHHRLLYQPHIPTTYVQIYRFILLFYSIAFQQHITLARINFIFIFFSLERYNLFRRYFVQKISDDRNTTEKKNWSQSEMEWTKLAISKEQRIDSEGQLEIFIVYTQENVFWGIYILCIIDRWLWHENCIGMFFFEIQFHFISNEEIFVHEYLLVCLAFRGVLFHLWRKENSQMRTQKKWNHKHAHTQTRYNFDIFYSNYVLESHRFGINMYASVSDNVAVT